MRTLTVLTAASAALCLLCGCQTAPLPPSGFNPNTQRLAAPHRAKLFQRVWASEGLRDHAAYELYHEIYIAPVNTEFLTTQNTLRTAAMRSPAGVQKDAEFLADYMRRAMIREFRRARPQRFTVVDRPGPHTLTIELAIVELVPSQAIFNTLTDAVLGDFFWWAPLISKLYPPGRIAIEGRFREGANGRIVAMFSDRRNDLLSPINLRDYTWNSGSAKNIDDWARQTWLLLNSPPDKVIRRSLFFTFIPW
jgi:hypothetical protein